MFPIRWFRNLFARRPSLYSDPVEPVLTPHTPADFAIVDFETGEVCSDHAMMIVAAHIMNTGKSCAADIDDDGKLTIREINYPDLD